MMTLEDEQFDELQRLADDRHIHVQELIRAVVIPEWFRMNEPQEGKPGVRELDPWRLKSHAS